MTRWAGIRVALAILGVLALAACGSGSSSTATKVQTTNVLFAFVQPATSAADRDRTADLMQARLRALGAHDAKVDVRDGRLVARGSPSLRRLAAAVEGRGLLEFRPVLAMVAPEGPTAIPSDSPAPVLPSRSGASSAVRYAVGPPALNGGIVSASARNLGGAEGWVVDFTFTREAKRIFNELAADSFPKQPPENSVAIVLDGVVQSAPAFRTPSFSGSVQISGNFTESEAEAIAAALDTGAYPVAVRTV